MRPDNRNISFVAWSQEASLTDIKQHSRLVAHKLNESFDGQYTLIN
jgi:hypothetical protein